jgi:hypothetical protein
MSNFGLTPDSPAFGEKLTDRVHEFIQAQLAERAEVAIGTMLIIEVMLDDGQKAIWTLATDRLTVWTKFGMLEFAKQAIIHGTNAGEE